MTAIVVGGHARNVGKTSIVAGLIRAFKEYQWTAIKISSHHHEDIAVSPTEDGGRFYQMYEEKDRDGAGDTSRFLAAGACRSLWMRIEEGRAEEGMRQLPKILESFPYAMIESNRILSVLRPDLFLMVLRYDTTEFKDSARTALEKADAVIAVNPESVPAPWEGVPRLISEIPQFVTPDPRIVPAELISFVESRLQKEAHR